MFSVCCSLHSSKMSITTTEREEQTSCTQYEADTYKVRTDIHRRNNFTRSPSLDKIIKFNTYICSQNFFILPSILAWLKTSHTVLKSYAGRCTAIVKAVVYSSMLYKIIQAQASIMAAAFSDVSISEPKQFLRALKVILMETERSLEQLPEKLKRKLLKSAVYFCFFFIFLQLALCLWSLNWRLVPSGLIFLLVCLTIISYANYNCLRFIIIEELLKEEERNATPTCTHISRGYIRRKDILGQRTISKVKLF